MKYLCILTGQLVSFQLQSVFPESISVFWTYDLERVPDITEQTLFATYLGPCLKILQMPLVENISLSDRTTTVRNLEPSSSYWTYLLVTVHGFPENRSEVVETIPTSKLSSSAANGTNIILKDFSLLQYD